MERVKLLVAYHKPSKLLQNEVLTPIHVGRALAKKQRNNTESLLEEMIGDDTGDNISELNRSYNEMTAIYWAWKNYDQLGDPEAIGFMHYRRHFIFDVGAKGTCQIINQITDDYLEKLYSASRNVGNLLKQYDFIAPRPFYRNTVYEHYKKNHRIEDLDLILELLKEQYPEYLPAAQKYLQGQNAYFFNMFVFPKDIFFEYAEWIFNLLEQFSRRVDISEKRLFISERLTGIFIQSLMERKKRGLFLPTMYLEGPHIIPVLLSTDENYVMPTCVTLCSLLETAKKTTTYHFYIQLSPEVTDESMRQIQRIEQFYDRCQINLIPMGDSYQDANMRKCHITRPTYYRLSASELFPKINKMIYLDSDVVATKDLTEFYDINIDDFIVAGVKAPSYHLYEATHKEWYCRKIGIPDLNQYINAGIILMNLEKMRRRDMVTQFQQLSLKDNPSQDQDVLNLACYNEIKIIPPVYNNMFSKADNTAGNLELVYTREEIENAKNKPVLIHYCDRKKPWNDKNCMYADVWNQFYTRWKEKEKNRNKVAVSVIIPVYNGEKYLKECLDSAYKQTLKELEVICIDDGSTDRTQEILSEYTKLDVRFRWIAQEHQGVSYSRNRGIKEALGEYVCFLDADDYYPSDQVLEILYHKAVIHHALICGGSVCEDHDGKIVSSYRKELQPYLFKEEGFVSFQDYQFDYGYCRFLFQRKFLYEKGITFPPYQRFQDPPFFVRAMVLAERFYAIPMFTHCYRWGHKQVQWTREKVNDFLKAIIDLMELTREYHLANLHRFVIRHVNVHNYNAILSQGEESNEELYQLLKIIEQLVDETLLKETGALPEECVIRPLKELEDKEIYRQKLTKMDCSIKSTQLVIKNNDLKKKLFSWGDWVLRLLKR